MPFDPVQAYLQEAEELIADIEESVLALTSADNPGETVNRLFRDFHTIKGSGAMCGLDTVAGFTHHVEALLSRVREGAVPVSDALVDLILRATDQIKSLLDFGPNSAARSSHDESLAAEIAGFLSPEARFGQDQSASPSRAIVDGDAEERAWRIRFHPDPGWLISGGSPVALLRQVRKLGRCEILAHADEVPPLESLQTDRCYLWWTIDLQTTADENEIRDVFIFVEDGSSLQVEREAANRDGAAECNSRQPARPVLGTPGTRHPPLAKEATVRVPAERLDRLVNLVGEFVMNHSCLAQAASRAGAAEFLNPVQVLERLVAELRDNVLGIRMLPIGTLFGRFRRVVHDLSAELGKEAELVTEGDETELDKSILDQLGEPLVHCLRNSLDHGIETAEERVEKGKPHRATIRLSAAHVGANVVISVADDGRGIDRKAVLAKAVEKRLVAADAILTEHDILNLVLLPGFSTAREITAVSGRGVGMDAVKRQIDSLRGSLSLTSIEDKGTRVSITLPLTLAIIDGLLVEVGPEQFILPMSVVTENVELNREDRTRNNGRNVLAVRGELVPYIDLRQAFRIAGQTPAVEKVVIVQHGDDRVGLVVDRVLGTHQTVIQALGKVYRKVEAASGATIMGDGRVRLILDTAKLIQLAARVRPPVRQAAFVTALGKAS